MNQVTVDEIRLDLSGCLHRVATGETLVVVDAGGPIAEIKPVTLHTVALRPAGLGAGEFRLPDDFNEPLPEAVLSRFEGH